MTVLDNRPRSQSTVEDAQAGEPDLTRWFLDTPHQVKPEVEHTLGLDDKNLLFDPARGKYLALSPSAGALVASLDGTRTGRQLLAERSATATPQQIERVARLLDDIRQSGFLTEAPRAEGARQATARFARREHLLRLPLITDIGRWLEPVVAPLRTVPGALLSWIWIGLAGLGIAIGLVGLTTAYVPRMPGHLWVVPVVLAAQIAVHELAHALVCQYLRAPAREAGIGLMFYFMPVGYVDRTDSYRVRSRAGRVMISLAGPLSDQIWFGVAGVVALTAPQPVASLAVLVMVSQLFLTAMNFNPLSPSDGYHAVTASLGIINLRGNALSYIVHLVLRTPLPTHFETKGRVERGWLIAYAAACLGFVALALTFTVRAVLGVLALFT